MPKQIRVQWPIDIGKLRSLMKRTAPMSPGASAGATPDTSPGKSPLAQLLQYIKVLQQSMGAPGQIPTSEIVQTAAPTEPIKIGTAKKLAACRILRNKLVKAGSSGKFWRAYTLTSIKSGRVE